MQTQQTKARAFIPSGKRVGPNNALIGARLKAIRIEARESQIELAHILGVTFQQVQKYEKGRNRIAADTMQTIADHYRRPVSDFLPVTDAIVDRAMSLIDFVTDTHAARLNSAFAKVKNAETRRTIADAVVLMCERSN